MMKAKSSRAKGVSASLTLRQEQRSRKRAVLATIQGRRVGTKKRDMRWEAPDGSIWASRFEYEVSARLVSKGILARRATPAEVFNYSSPVRGGVCMDCKSQKVAQLREYTPDLFLTRADNRQPGYYIEAKGYIRSNRRSLLRAFRATRPEVPLRLIVQRDYNITPTMTIVQWAQRYLKVPVHVWNGDIPEDWK